MQSFKYAVPHPPSPPPRGPSRRRAPRVIALVAAVAVLGGLVKWSYDHAPDASGSLGWVLGRPAVADERARKADQLLLEGEKQLATSEYVGAQRRFGEALRLHPLLLAAWDRARLARYLQSEAKGPTAASLVPDPEARLQLLIALAEREREARRFAAADAFLAEAVALAPRDPRAHVAVGRLRDAQDDLKAARAAFDHALSLAPDDVGAVTARFAVRLRLGEIDPACQEAIEALRPRAAKATDPAVRIGLLEAYLHQGLAADEVRRRFAQDAPALAPAERELLLARAWLRHYENNPNWHRESFDRVLEACATLRKAGANATPEQRAEAVRLTLAAHDARAKRFLDRSDVDAARAEVERALKLAPELPGERRRFADLHAERARLLTLAGKAEAANKALEAAIALVPDHPGRTELANVQAGLGMTLLSAGKTAAAIGHFRRAVTLDPTDDGLLARYFQALGGKDRMAAVAACADAASVVDPGRILARLAHGFSQARKPAEARAVVSLAQAQRVGAGRLAEIRAEVQRASGQRTLARQALLQALEHAPSPDLWLRLAAVEEELAAAKRARGDADAQAAHLADALEAYRHAAALAPEGPGAARALDVSRDIAAYWLKRGQAAKAERAAAEGRVLAPNDPQLASTQAEALVKLGKLDDARRACADGLAGIARPGDPAHAALRLRQGQVLRKMKRHLEAVEALKAGLAEEVAASPARCADLWFELAFAHADARQREEALNAARQYAFWSLHDNQQKKRLPHVRALELGLTKS